MTVASALAESATVLGACSAMGLAIDKLVLANQKKYLENKMIEYWLYIESIKLVDMTKIAGSKYIDIKNYIIGNEIYYIYKAIRYLLVSVIMTTFVFFVGQFGAFYIAHINNNAITNLELINATLWVFKDNLTLSKIYPTNMLFDIISIVVTTYFMSKLINTRNHVFRFLIILLDIVACILMFYICLYILFNSNLLYSNNSNIFNFHEELLYRLGFHEAKFDYFFMIPNLAYTSTIFYPTIIYLTILLFIFFAHLFIVILKLTGLQIFEISSQNDKTIFFFTGTFIGILSSIVVIISKLF